MDGLSAASSVIAVIQITQFVGVFLRDLYRDIRNARAEIERLYDSVVSLEFVAKGLDDLVERRGIAIVNSVLLEDPNGPLKQALSELPRVKEKLEVQTVDGLFEKLKLSVSQSRERSLKWPFKKEEVLHIVARLESHKSTLVLDVGVNTLSVQFEQSSILEDIKREITTAQNDAHRQQLVNWLASSVPDPSIEHNAALGKHEETTGSWLLDGDSLKEWSIAPNSYLWLHGNAGAGKSILCSTVIAHIQEQCKNEPNSAVAYWYFTFRDSDSQNVDQCLRSLVANLCSKRKDTPKALQEAYELANNGQLSPSIESLMTMLNSAIDGFEHVYIFLDALDECPKSGRKQKRERDDLLERLYEICSWKKDCLHVFTTSRRERDIEEVLIKLSSESENFRDISVQGSYVEEDIKKYIRHKFEARQFKNWKADLKEEVEEKLASQANGMFRLVALQLDVLLEWKSIAGIKKALNTLPTTLDEFYDYTLRVIDEQHEPKAYAVLQWLAFSARPLLLSELAESIIIQPRGESYVDPDERFMDEDQVLDLLPAGLVRKVFKPVEIVDNWSTLPYIEFAHFSVLEYLKSDRMCSDLRPKYQIEEIKTHTMIGEACLAYLLYIGETEQTFAKDMENISGAMERITRWRRPWQLRRKQLNTDYTLADYANRAWTYHLCHLESVTSEYLDTLALKFLNHDANSWTIWCYYGFEDRVFHYAKSLLDPNRRTRIPSLLAEKIHPVTWISWLGLSGLLRLLLKKAGDLSQLPTTPLFGSPLHAAAAKGNAQIVQILLQSQADVNERGGYYGTPLSAASSSGSVEVVKILLESGADIDARGDSDNKYTSALGWAVRIIKPNLVSFLLESGANIGSRQEPGGIYKYAVKKYEDSSDYEKIIELLDAYVEKQQKSNMQDNLAEPECPPPHIHAVEPEGRHEEYGVASADVS